MIADLIRRMKDAGAPMEAILIAVDAIEAEQAKDAARREKRAAQKRKEREEERERLATVARQSLDKGATVASDAPPNKDKRAVGGVNHNPPSEDISSPLSPTGTSPKGDREPPPAAILENEFQISAETARNLVAHRKAIKHPLTAGTARGLGKKLVAWRDGAEAAAQIMLAEGWRGFNRDWAENLNARPQARAGPFGRPEKRNEAIQAGQELLRELSGCNHAENLEPSPEPFDGKTITLDARQFRLVG